MFWNSWKYCGQFSGFVPSAIWDRFSALTAPAEISKSTTFAGQNKFVSSPEREIGNITYTYSRIYNHICMYAKKSDNCCLQLEANKLNCFAVRSFWTSGAHFQICSAHKLTNIGGFALHFCGNRIIGKCVKCFWLILPGHFRPSGSWRSFLHDLAHLHILIKT